MTTTDNQIETYLQQHPVEARPKLAAPTPSARLAELDFLLGTVESRFDTGVRFITRGRPIMNGLYVQVTLDATYADGSWRNNGLWIIGWSAPDDSFQSYYVDALGNQGCGSSAGWRDGTLEFVGSFVLAEVGARGMTKDHYTRVDEDHFILEAYVEVGGEWKKWNTQECHRLSPDPDAAIAD